MDHNFTRNPNFKDYSLPSKFSERLWLSGASTAGEHWRKRQLGITAVANLTPEDFGCGEAGFKVFQLQIEDAEELDPAVVGQFIAQMQEWERSNETVLIHCHAGISRTSSFTIAWLMHLRGCTRDSDLRSEWSACEDLVREARPIILPHYLLKRAVLDYFAGIS